MEISKTLENAINSGKVSSMRSVFYTIAHEDPGFYSGKFHNTLAYMQEKNVMGLIEKYDGKEFAPESEWTEEYWAEVASDMVDNFCMERITHLEAVGKKVYPCEMKDERNSRQVFKANQKKTKIVQKSRKEHRVCKSRLIIGASIVVVILILILILK